MVDDVSLRNRRHQRHRKGDHSLCRSERCAALGAVVQAPSSGDGVVESYRAKLEAVGRLDTPEAGLVLLLASRLVEKTLTGSALASVSRELRAAYEAAIKDADIDSADVIDGIFKSA